MKKHLAIALMLALLTSLTLAGCANKARHVLNITVENGPGCMVTPASGTTFANGTIVELSAVGAAGYVLDHWGGTDGSLVTTDNTILIDGDKNIVAVFTRLQYDLTVEASPAAGGAVMATLAIQPQSVFGIEMGQAIQLNANPNPGYVFDHWEGLLTGSENPTTLTLTEQPSQAVIACFVPSLHGRVMGMNSNRGVPGITITGGSVSTTTDNDGFWQLKGVSFPVVVTASAPAASGYLGVVFSPASIEVNSISGADIQIAMSAYKFEKSWGSSGAGSGQFNYPAGIALDGSGRIYVADTYNNRIQVFDSDGAYLAQWGSSGSGSGQFASPNGIAMDHAGNIYVADLGNHRIQKFGADGTYLTQWGSKGTSEGQFNCPCGVAVDTAGNVYVTDRQNHRVQKFGADGTFLIQWGSYGPGNGKFNSPGGIAVNKAGHVIVADSNGFIQEFSPEGVLLRQWGSNGTGNGQFTSPGLITVDTESRVFASDSFNDRIQLFDASGTYMTQWGSSGTANGQLDYPDGIAVDAAGNVYVSDVYNQRIQKFRLAQ